MKRLCADLDDAFHARVKEAAAAKGLPLAAFVRGALAPLVEDGASAGAPLGPLRSRVLTVMRASPGEVFSAERLRPLVQSRNTGSVRNMLRRLAQDGEITKQGAGKYLVTAGETGTEKPEGGAR